MDSGKGTFIPTTGEALGELEKELAEKGEPMPDGIFREGEILEMRGSRFRVMRTRQSGTMVLKLLKRGVVVDG